MIPRWRSEGRGRSLRVVGTIMRRAKSSVKCITLKIRNASVVVSVHSTCWKKIIYQKLSFVLKWPRGTVSDRFILVSTLN